MSIEFIIHEDGDSVGVAAVEGLKSGSTCSGWIMKEDVVVDIKILNDIPIGHKVALKDLAVGDDVIKYSTVIGKVVVAIRKGEHLHVHNVKTRRW